MKLKISPTMLEAYRLWATGDWMPESDLTATILRKTQPSRKMQIGSAAHSLLQAASLPAGDTVAADGIDFLRQSVMAARQSIPSGSVFEVSASTEIEIPGHQVVLSGRADCLHGNRCIEFKISERPDVARYMDSAQWRAYCVLFGVPSVEYQVIGYSESPDGIIELKAPEILVCHAHPWVDVDVNDLIRDFINYCERAGIIHALLADIPQSIQRAIAPDKEPVADADYVFDATPAAPTPAGATPETLPALRIEVRGQVVSSNLIPWRDGALAIIRWINRDLQTDQQFADAERTVKWASDSEAKLKAAKDSALSQASDIDALFRAVDAVSEELRRTRLDLEKLIKARKESIKTEIAQYALNNLREQVAHGLASLGEFAPAIPADAAYRIGDAMKGKKLLSTLREAADTARAAIAAGVFAQIDRITSNLEAARRIEAETGMAHLWKFDLMTILHSSATTEQVEALLRDRIRQAQEAAERLAAEKAAREQAETERLTRAALEQAAALIARSGLVIAEGAAAAIESAPAGPPAAPLKLIDINALIAPLSITSAGLASIGFEPVGRDRAAVLYRADDMQRICAALIEVLRAAAAK